MKKYRLTKITIRTKETILMSEKTTQTSEVLVCPVCHTSISTAECLTAATEHAPQPAQIAPAGEQDR